MGEALNDDAPNSGMSLSEEQEEEEACWVRMLAISYLLERYCLSWCA